MTKKNFSIEITAFWKILKKCCGMEGDFVGSETAFMPKYEFRNNLKHVCGFIVYICAEKLLIKQYKQTTAS